MTDLAGQEIRVSVKTRGGEAVADLRLVPIHLPGVDMTITQGQRALHRRPAHGTIHTIGAEAKLGEG